MLSEKSFHYQTFYKEIDMLKELNKELNTLNIGKQILDRIGETTTIEYGPLTVEKFNEIQDLLQKKFHQEIIDRTFRCVSFSEEFHKATQYRFTTDKPSAN